MRPVNKAAATTVLFIGLAAAASATGASAAAPAHAATLAVAPSSSRGANAAIEAMAPTPLTLLLEPAALLAFDSKQAQAQSQQQQDPDGGRGMEGKKDPPPRAATRGLRTRARVPTSHHQKVVHELMAAAFLALGVAVVGLLACCVVRCDASRVCPCLGNGPRAPATEDEVNIEESPGAKAADWPAQIDAQQQRELEGGEEGKAAEAEAAGIKEVMTTGVAAPVLLQAASAMWGSVSSLFGLLGSSGGDIAAEQGKTQDKTQQLEAAEAKEPEWQPAQ